MVVAGDFLPRIDISKPVATGTTDEAFDQFSIAIGKVRNSELLRGQLIDLETLRAENQTKLHGLETAKVGTQIAAQKTLTAQAKLSAEIERTNLALEQVNGLVFETQTARYQNEQSALKAGYEQLKTAQLREQLETELAQLGFDNSLGTDALSRSAKKLAAQTNRTITVPSVTLPKLVITRA